MTNRTSKSKRIAAALLFSLLVALTTTAHADAGDQELTFSLVPLNLSWYVLDPPEDEGENYAGFYGLGGAISYYVATSENWELGARVIGLQPRGGEVPSGRVYEFLGTLGARANRPFAGGHGRWTLGIHGGINRLLWGDFYRFNSWVGGLEAGFRVHIKSNFWLAVDVMGNLALSDSFDTLRFSQVAIGMSYRPGPHEYATEAPGSTPPYEGKSTISGILETILINVDSIDPLPFFGIRYTREIGWRVALELRAASMVALSTAQVGAMLEFGQGGLRPYVFGRLGALVGLQDRIEVSTTALIGAGLSHTGQGGLYTFVEAGAGAMSDIRGDLGSSGVDANLQFTAGVGVRR